MRGVARWHAQATPGTRCGYGGRCGAREPVHRSGELRTRVPVAWGGAVAAGARAERRGCRPVGHTTRCCDCCAGFECPVGVLPPFICGVRPSNARHRGLVSGPSLDAANTRKLVLDCFRGSNGNPPPATAASRCGCQEQGLPRDEAPGEAEAPPAALPLSNSVCVRR